MAQLASLTVTRSSSASRPNDQSFISSYNNWFFGGLNDGKFTALDNQAGAYVTLTLVGGQINGTSISQYPSCSVTVNSGSVVYVDDGYGSFPENYVSFLNTVSSAYSLKTSFTGKGNGGNSYNTLAYFDQTDNFTFIFKETTNLVGFANPCYFALTSRYLNLVDAIGVDLNSIISNITYYPNPWIPGP